MATTRRLGRLCMTLLAVAVLLCGCRFGKSGGPQPRSHQPTVLGRGTADGKPWVLTVFSNPEGDLCMAINDQLASTAAPDGDTLTEGGCGFGPPDQHLSGPVDGAVAGGTRLLWGPAPQAAVRVRLDAFSVDPQSATDPRAANIPGCLASTPAQLWVDITDRLPAWTQPGGWFVIQTASAGCGYSDAVFYDAQGKVVPEHRW